MKRAKEIIKLLRMNFGVLIGFEIIYKLSAMMVFIPVFGLMFRVIMRVRGYQYLTAENIGAFFINPLTLGLILLLIALMAFCAMLDISAVIFILDMSAQDKKAHLAQVVRFSYKNSLRVLKRRNILLSLTVLFIIPFLNLGVDSSLIGSISLPEFIMNALFKRRMLAAMFVLAIILLASLLMRWIYAFHYFTLEGLSFREARRRSAALSRKRRLKTFAALLLVQAVGTLLHTLLLMAGIALIVWLGGVFDRLLLMKVVTAAPIWLFTALSLVFAVGLATPSGYAVISILFYGFKAADGEQVTHCEAPPYELSPQMKKRRHAANIALGCGLIALSAVFVYSFYSGRINPPIEYIRMVEITAHRGASVNYPENTMAAFEAACELGADWIELDVQQSADGQIFVMHDSNFRRTTGLNANSWELTYDRISELDAGSRFGAEFAGERVPLLEQVIEFAVENGIRLNIELKPSGHEKDFERAVVDIILENGFENDCVITSQVYSVLENVKEYSDRVTTVYVMSFAYGRINKLSAADHFSVEASSVTRSLVSRIHNSGKQIYAWTVNTEDNINKMINLNVDNIITDDITLARECVYGSRLGSVIDEFVKVIE